MAGRQHHYLPQLIQRPFAHRRQGREHYVYAHHRTRGSFAPNTKGLGKQLDFYGGPNDSALDDAITEIESDLAATVQAVNEGTDVARIRLATLICSLAFRAKSMREALASLLPSVLSALRVQQLDLTRLRREILARLTNPKETKMLIYEQIEKTLGPLPREKRAKAYALTLARWKALAVEQEEELVKCAWQLLDTALERASTEADAIADGAYLAALARDPGMPIRAGQLAEAMTFEIVDAPPGEYYILGDCGPVAVFSDGKPRLAFMAFDSDVQMDMVFLPCSPTRCIVGRRLGVTMRMSTSEINEVSAGMSLEFFISNRNSGDELERLRASIGSLDPIDAHEEITRALSLEAR